MPSTNGHGPKRAILYARVSTDEQVRSGYSPAQQDEGNAYARLGEVLGREDEARDAYEAGIRQAEKFGHTGMAEDLRLALIQLRE
jgi:DNA invertase Pin-like site-specific DNA recombinase